ncbi:MAG: flavodoxin domain-containing protein [Bifidobacteriaceae bacterium]|jgi:menaquinone-dependent protoporphyrinogen oxidase|nr:flavodoxin domain-containing protein [Bifidobacteriaceae bacterium]
MKALITVASKHGATLGIAETIAGRLRAHGIATEMVSPASVTTLDGVDAVLIGSALYANRMLPAIGAFAGRWDALLPGLATWVFVSGPLDSGEVDSIPVPKDVRDLAFRISAPAPKLFPGRMNPETLKPTERAVMRMIGAKAGDYRDFTSIEEWADGVAERLLETEPQ